MSVDALPEIADLIVEINTANVVILIPLPVDPGDDPMNALIIMSSSVAN